MRFSLATTTIWLWHWRLTTPARAVDKYHGIPPYNETRAYVARVIHEFNRRVLARESAGKGSCAPQTRAHGKTRFAFPSSKQLAQ